MFGYYLELAWRSLKRTPVRISGPFGLSAPDDFALDCGAEDALAGRAEDLGARCGSRHR